MGQRALSLAGSAAGCRADLSTHAIGSQRIGLAIIQSSSIPHGMRRLKDSQKSRLDPFTAIGTSAWMM
jgi:hypothetical protein